MEYWQYRTRLIANTLMPYPAPAWLPLRPRRHPSGPSMEQADTLKKALATPHPDYPRPKAERLARIVFSPRMSVFSISSVGSPRFQESWTVPHYQGPLLTRTIAESLAATRDSGSVRWSGSMDLDRSESEVLLQKEFWTWHGRNYPYSAALKERTIYYWDGDDFAPISRFSGSLIKLIPTPWGAPTFEIDGIKMLPSAKTSPIEDARLKVALVEPQGKTVLDTCGGLGYFAACCLEAGAARIQSFEKNADVLWLRTLNPWSPDAQEPATKGRLELHHQNICEAIEGIASGSVDALLHDPPRFGIAGELYAQTFYQQLARVLRRGGRLFHYTGSPNKLTTGRDVPKEVAKRLEKAGFKATLAMDGVLANKR